MGPLPVMMLLFPMDTSSSSVTSNGASGMRRVESLGQIVTGDADELK